MKPKVELSITSEEIQMELIFFFVIFMSEALYFNEFSACFI